MDYTITTNPYEDGTKTVNFESITVSSRAAKMNERKDKKVTKIRNFWEKNRTPMEEAKEAQEIVSMVASKEHGYATVMAGLGLSTLFYEDMANVGGFKKLKVNELVRSKTLNFYEGTDKITSPKAILEEEKTVELKEEIEKPTAPLKEEKETVSQNHTESPIEVTDTRTSRYSEPVSNGSDVINTPSRFAQPRDNHVQANYPSETRANSLPSRSERKPSDYASLVDAHVASRGGLEVGEGEKVLNKIASLNHGNNGGVTTDLEDAMSQFKESEAEKQASIDTVLKLEAEVKNAEKALEQQRASQIADLRARTEANREETLGLTMHSEDLKQKLAELRSQLAAGQSTSVRR